MSYRYTVAILAAAGLYGQAKEAGHAWWTKPAPAEVIGKRNETRQAAAARPPKAGTQSKPPGQELLIEPLRWPDRAVLSRSSLRWVIEVEIEKQIEKDRL